MNTPEKPQLERLLLVADTLVGHVMKTGVFCWSIRITGGPKGYSAKFGGQEGRAKVVGSAVQGGRADCYEAGEIVIFAAQPVVDPGTHARPQKGLVSGMHFHACTSVGNVGLAE